MGKLRVQPKKKVMDPERYKDLHQTLLRARDMSTTNHIYFDLDHSEDANRLRRDFMHISKMEKIDLVIKRPRGTNSLSLIFPNWPRKRKRLPVGEAQKRILDALEEGGPMKKSQIQAATGIPDGSWTRTIRNLVTHGLVIREGYRRDSVYTKA